MERYKDWIVRFYASHEDIPEGHTDGEMTELIRCKDCKHQRKQEVRGYRGNINWIYWCDKEDDISMLGADDQFCSEGERKEDVRD